MWVESDASEHGSLRVNLQTLCAVYTSRSGRTTAFNIRLVWNRATSSRRREAMRMELRRFVPGSKIHDKPMVHKNVLVSINYTIRTLYVTLINVYGRRLNMSGRYC
jgi:hypothetical protein